MVNARHLETIVAQSLTASAYAPFGRVIEVPRGASGLAANQGSAARFDHLVKMENARGDGAPLNVSLFRCAPRKLPFEIALLEKHPRSTQVFVPMRARRYLVVVSEGRDAPDLSTLRVFEGARSQGISYHPSVWHHPMIALDETSDFLCLVHEDGSENDCVVHELATDHRLFVMPMSQP